MSRSHPHILGERYPTLSLVQRAGHGILLAVDTAIGRISRTGGSYDPPTHPPAYPSFLPLMRLASLRSSRSSKPSSNRESCTLVSHRYSLVLPQISLHRTVSCSHLGYFPVDYIASALDPRTKILGFLPAAHAEATWNHLKGLESAHSSTMSSRPAVTAPAVQSSDGDLETAFPHIDIEALLVEQTLERDSTSVTEVDSYQNCPQIPFSQSPLHWWSKRAEDFPFLASLAMVLSMHVCILSPTLLIIAEVSGLPCKLCSCREIILRRK